MVFELDGVIVVSVEWRRRRAALVVTNRTRGLRYDNDDGSVTIYLHHETPADGHELIGLQTPAGAFWPVLRTYQPDESILDGSYPLRISAERPEVDFDSSVPEGSTTARHHLDQFGVDEKTAPRPRWSISVRHQPLPDAGGVKEGGFVIQ